MAGQLQSKVLDLDELLAAIQRERVAGKSIVHCHGCFDVVHPGHIRYLEFARAQGDVLIVSLTGDLDVNKGPNRPYIPQELRAENLAALVFVDHVFINPDPTAQRLLEQVRPDLYVKGHEYENSTDPGFLAEKAVVESYGGRMVYSSGEIVFSSTELIGRMPRAADGFGHRLKRLCARYQIDRPGLLHLLDSFKDQRVLVVGDLIIDRYVFCDATGIAGEGPMMSLVQRDERRYLGGAAIVARHVAALGARAFLLGSAPALAHADAKLAADTLTGENVEFDLIESRPALVEKTRFLAEDAKLFKVDRAQRLPLDSIAERQAARVLEQQSKGVDAVILCDFGYGMITDSLLNRVLPSLRHNARVITADVSGGRANLLNFRNVDLLCPTEREARAMLNDHDSGIATIAWEVLRRTQALHIMITLGKRGLLAFERRSPRRDSPEWSGRLKSEQLPPFAEFAVDNLGCGDALLAAGTLALACGATLMQSTYLGNAAAAIEAGELGNQPIPAARLREWLTARPELTAPPIGETPATIDSRAVAIAGPRTPSDPRP